MVELNVQASKLIGQNRDLLLVLIDEVDAILLAFDQPLDILLVDIVPIGLLLRELKHVPVSQALDRVLVVLNLFALYLDAKALQVLLVQAVDLFLGLQVSVSAL